MSEKLVEYIKQLYNPPLSDEEAVKAKDNLVGFFKILQEADQRLRREKEAEKKRRRGKEKSDFEPDKTIFVINSFHNFAALEKVAES
jgi:hypothetical protein